MDDLRAMDDLKAMDDLAMDDLKAMEQALQQARSALLHDDVPVGAVIVYQGAIIARGHNRREANLDPLAHAEIEAIAQAAQHLGCWRLSGCTLYVTLEPCPMCAGALVNARVDRLVFATQDPRAGACGSIMNIVQDTRLNHRLEIESGLLAKQAADLLQSFFREKRIKKGRHAHDR